MERWSAQTKGLPALKVGQHVNIQNQRGTGKIAKRWDRTGVVVEDLGHNKYRVRIDGSGRVTDRNRQFLRLFKPATFTYSPGITQTTQAAESQPLVGDGHGGHPDGVPEVPNAPVGNGHEGRQNAAPEVSNAPIAPPPLYTPYQALEGLNQQQAGAEATPDVQTPHVEYNPEPVAKPTPEPHQPTPAEGSEQVPGPHGPLRRSVRVRKPNQLYGQDVYDLRC